MSEQKAYKTRFNMYVPYDYEIYKKLKKIKAVINLSYIESRRFMKWSRKAPHNRTKPEPQPCLLFYKKTSKTIPGYIYYKKTGEYKKVERVIESYDTISYKDDPKISLASIFMEAYLLAKTPKEKEEDIKKSNIDWEAYPLNDIYYQCLEWQNHFLKKRKSHEQNRKNRSKKASSQREKIKRETQTRNVS